MFSEKAIAAVKSGASERSRTRSGSGGAEKCAPGALALRDEECRPVHRPNGAPVPGGGRPKHGELGSSEKQSKKMHANSSAAIAPQTTPRLERMGKIYVLRKKLPRGQDVQRLLEVARSSRSQLVSWLAPSQLVSLARAKTEQAVMTR